MNSLDMQDRIAVVTGAARGIGLAVADRLLRSGARVALWDINREAVERQAERLMREIAGSKALAVEVDLTSSDAVDVSAGRTEAELGAVDCLVNNAVLVRPEKPFHEVSDEDFLDLYDVNMVGIHRVCRRLIPPMMERGFGRVVNMGSTAGKNGTEYMSAYSASKSAIINYTKVVGREIASSGVLVNVVVPSATNTEGLTTISPDQLARIKQAIPMRRIADASEIAALVAWLCTRDCAFSTGATFDVAGGRTYY